MSDVVSHPSAVENYVYSTVDNLSATVLSVSKVAWAAYSNELNLTETVT